MSQAESTCTSTRHGNLPWNRARAGRYSSLEAELRLARWEVSRQCDLPEGAARDVAPSAQRRPKPQAESRLPTRPRQEQSPRGAQNGVPFYTVSLSRE